MSREILTQIESQFRYITDWELVVLARALDVDVLALVPAKFQKGRKVLEVE